MVARVSGCLFVPTLPRLLFVERAACRFAALRFDVWDRHFWLDFISSRDSDMARDLDKRIDRIRRSWSVADYCGSASRALRLYEVDDA